VLSGWTQPAPQFITRPPCSEAAAEIVPLMTESLNLGRLMLILVLRPGKSNKSCYFAAVHESVHGTYQTKLAGQSMSALPGCSSVPYAIACVQKHGRH
jgi:hypothetical protein